MTLKLTFTQRAEPLTPCAVYAVDAVASRLVARLLAFDDEHLRVLRGVSSQHLVLALGAEEALPWLPGVHFLGRDPDAADLLVPTTLTPSVPGQILTRAVHELAGSSGGSCALLAEPPRVVSLDQALCLSRDRLNAWQQSYGAAT